MPDDLDVTRAVDAVLRRARIVVAAEAAAVGVAVAAASPIAGFVAAVAVAVWRARATSRVGVIRALERSDRRWNNVLVTADELIAGALTAKPAVRDRVLGDAAQLSAIVDPRTAFPIRRAAVFAAIAIVAWTMAAAFSVYRGGRAPESTTARDAIQPPLGSGSAAFHVTVVSTPPAYAGRAASTIVDPADIRVLDGTAVLLRVESAASKLTLEHDGALHPLARTVSNTFEYRTPLTKSGYILITADDRDRRLIPIAIVPDRLPSVRISAPARDLIYSGGNPRIRFEARATDDLGLRALALQFTKVSGSGEQLDFTEGEIPLAVVKDGARDWHGTASRTLADLALEEGDMLVYRAVAADARPTGGEASSDAFFIEVSRLGVAPADAFTLPEQETRYALSQQMLIVKTERLQQRRSALSPAAFAEAAIDLAVAQRMIRAELVFMLGGEIEDEDVEAEQSTEIQEGRLANRGQRDVRAATVAMSQAEKLLTGANTAGALVAERTAVAALQRAFARDRYILRALATRDRLDSSRRLAGTVAQPLGWRRRSGAIAEDRRTPLLQDLLVGIADLEKSAMDAGAANRASELAAFAVRIAPESGALRLIASDLQRLADRWATAGADARRASITAIAAQVVREARRAIADPPLVFRGAGR